MAGKQGTLGAVPPTQGDILHRGGGYAVSKAEASKAFKSQGRLAALQRTGDSHVANEPINRIFGPAEDAGNAQSQTGTSIFDPVLCECVYSWFCPPDGHVLDPFASGSVRGIVAGYLGRQYTGIELRPEQVEANRVQAGELEVKASWIVGNSKDAATLAPGEYDLVFSCPPYYDLEVYSDLDGELSAAPSYAEFIAGYREIVAASVGLLKDDRFACFVVGDIRDKKGHYRNFVSDTIAAFRDAGMELYNEAILVTAVGSLSIRVPRQFERGRKLGKTHQNVLVFLKGNWRKAVAACGPVDVTPLLAGSVGG